MDATNSEITRTNGGGADQMKTIKVFNINVPRTELERRVDYDRWKRESQEPAWIWDIWRELETHPFRLIEPSTIASIQVKSLLPWTIALSEGNPHIEPEKDREGDIWLQHDKDLRTMDLSMHEYRVPRDEKFRVAGLHLAWRKNGGAITRESKLFRTVTEIAPQSQVELSGEMSIYQPNGALAGALLAPVPFPESTRLLLTGETAESLNPLVKEINQANLWYQMHTSMLFTSHPQLIIPAPITWPPVIPAKDRILKLIAPYVLVKFVEGQVIADLTQLDILDMWQKLSLLPASDPRIQQSVSQLRSIWEDWQQMRSHQYLSQSITYKKTQQDVLADKMHPGKHWVDLSQKDKEKITKQIEYKKTMKESVELRRVIKNIHRSFTATIIDTSEMRRVMDQLKHTSDVARVKPGEFVTLQDGSKLCPHYVFIVRDTLSAPKNVLHQIDTQAVTQSCVQKFAEHVPVNFKYYCKDCGELLMTDELDDFIVFNQNIVSSSQEKDPIWAYILSECNQVVRRIRFTTPQAIRPLVLTLAQTLESEMLSQQSELSRSKTKSLEDIRGTMSIIISTYCFALVSKMIIDHPNRLRWNVITTPSAVGGKVHKQEDAVRVLSTAYSMLVDSNQNRISKIKDFSVDQIKPILLRAYEWARTAKFAQADTEEAQISDWSTSLINDPWYNLVYEMASSHMNISHTDFAKLFGNKDPISALCSAKPFEHAYRPPGKTIREQNYLCLLDYADSGIYREYAVPCSPMLIAWWKRWEGLLLYDKSRDKELQELSIRPTKQIYKFRGQVPTFRHLDISLIRCPSGELHDFSIFKFGKSTKLTMKQIKSDSTLIPAGAHLIDELCSHCGMSKYAKPNLHVKKVIDSELDKKNFFLRIKNQCPATSELHDYPVDKQGFVGDAECKKCSYRRSYAETHPDSYFNRWKKSLDYKPSEKISLEPDRKLWKVRSTGIDKWNVTLASVLQIANISHIPYNIWLNLGLSEHRNFTQIRQGKINPQSTINEELANARLIKLVGWVQFVQKQYLLVRNHSRVVVPPAIKQLLDEESSINSGKNIHKTIAENMPDILRDFNAKLDYYKTSQTAQVNCNFVLHTLCNTLISIRNISEIKRIAHKLFDYIVSAIIMGETMLSELEIQKIQSVALPEEESVEEDEDYLEKQEENDILDKGTEDPFSMADADIETSNTGADDEEFMS